MKPILNKTDPTEKQAVCLNCSTPLLGKFCHHCGQEDKPVNPSLFGFLRDYFNESFGYDSRLKRTLLYVVTRPGAITLNHNEGKRAAFIPPVKLYLFLSVIFFLSVGLAGHQETNFSREASFNAATYVQPKVHWTFYFNNQSDDTQIYKDKLSFLYDRKAELNQKILGSIPQALFLVFPLFALLLRLLLWRTKHRYIEHLMFSLHFHIFLFTLGGVTSWLFVFFQTQWLGLLVLLGYPLYLLLSLKSAYSLKYRYAVPLMMATIVVHFQMIAYVREVIKAYVVMSM